MLVLIFLSFLDEILLYTSKVAWAFRMHLAAVNIFIISFFSAWYLTSKWSVLGGLFFIVGLFRTFNMLRVVKNRMHDKYLHRVTMRTGLLLGSAQLLILGAELFDPTRFGIVSISMLTYLQLILSLGLFTVTIRNLQKTKHRKNTVFYSDKELPTISVLIPARNETDDLAECLRSVVSSDYPKLEIIVLDDCSHDKTSEVIKGFAKDGVRFIRGSLPEERWLPKNQAYERLREEASGDVLLFCGVDVRFGTHSIRAAVTTMLNRHKMMLSVLPRRTDSTVAAAFIQPMRYWWELVLPRRLFNRPPVLSTCWLIHTEALNDLGGFSSVCRAILPEAFLARELVQRSDAYSFVRSDDELQVETVKSVTEQKQTAIRVRYPQMHKRPENVLLLSMFESIFLLAPFCLLVLAIIGVITVDVWIVVSSCTLLIATHVLVVLVSNPANVPTAVFNFPIVVLTELVLLYISMIRYEFGTVEWKERNICIPVMHVIPHLPSLDTK